MIRKNKDPVEHFTDGRKAWRNEARGLTRLRAIVGTAGATVVFGGAPWWIQYLDKEMTISLPALLSIIVVIIGLILFMGLMYLRFRTIRSLDMKYQLHMIAHEIRDQYVAAQDKNTLPELMQTSRQLCNLVQRYFSILIEKSHIGVAIRIAKKDGNDIFYETVGRSCLNEHRAKTSKLLPANKGIARVLQDDKGRKGVMIYNDLCAAAKAGAFEEDDNCRNYPDDIKTMMVAPINGWDGEKKSMLGILYVTSDEDGVFGEKYTDSMGFVSDALASIFSELVVGRLNFRQRS